LLTVQLLTPIYPQLRMRTDSHIERIFSETPSSCCLESFQVHSSYLDPRPSLCNLLPFFLFVCALSIICSSIVHPRCSRRSMERDPVGFLLRVLNMQPSPLDPFYDIARPDITPSFLDKLKSPSDDVALCPCFPSEFLRLAPGSLSRPL